MLFILGLRFDFFDEYFETGNTITGEGSANFLEN